MKTPTSTIMTISPHQARVWLEKNDMNRPINKENLASLAKEMQNKNFHLTGESIKIATDGTLLDGQHRLMAIVNSGTAVKMFVIRDLPKEAFKFIDTGRTRQASDVLAIEGIKNATKIAAIVKFLVNFKRGRIAGGGSAARGINKISNSEVSEFVNKHSKALQDSYEFGHGKGKRLISGTFVSAMHYIFKNISESEADDFITKLVDGTNLTKTSPIFMLRERYIIDSRLKRKMRQPERIAIMIKAWNLYRKNKVVTRLVFDAKKENFPKPE